MAPGLPGRLFNFELTDGNPVNAAIHDYAGRRLIEIERMRHTYKDATPLFLVRSMLTRMQQAASVEQVCEIAVEQLKVLVGFDRVIIYKFLRDGSGSVVAESREPSVTSYLNQHFPASDIPQQARALYLKNWIRLIVDAASMPVPIITNGRSDDPVDLTYCGLRSVSPIHIEYMKNMGVAASMSISIIVGGKLWGLISCHNVQPKDVPADIRVAAEFFGQAFSLQLQSLEQVDVARMLGAARARIDRILTEIPATASLTASIGTRLQELGSLIPCDGAGLWTDDSWTEWGTCPPIGEIPSLAARLNRVSHSAVFVSDELQALHPPAKGYAAAASGLLAIPLSRTPSDYLMLFRKEHLHTVAWAGDPNKPTEVWTGGERLTPRKSFEAWRQDVKGKSRAWEPHDVLTAEALRISLLEIVLRYSELVAQERAKAERQQRMFAAELNHRVKNALALVSALVMQSKGRHRSVSTFVGDLEGRIRSLAAAHDLASTAEPLALRQLVETELAPYAGSKGPRTTITGPDVALEEHAAAVLALVIHELTTNAVKYGALSRETGSLAITWRFDDDGGCLLDWTEEGGPSVEGPVTGGLGTQLVRSQIPFELGGSAELDIRETGVRGAFKIPQLYVHPISKPPRGGVGQLAPPRLASQPLFGLSVMIVEDSLIVAFEAEQVARRIGASTVLVVSTLEEGLRQARHAAIDFALLDINLHGRPCFPIADVLVERQIPFLFATGYGTQSEMPERFAGRPVIAKPYSTVGLAEKVGPLFPER